MKITFVILLYIQSVLLTAINFNLHKIKSELSKRMRLVNLSGIFTCLSYSMVCYPLPEYFSYLAYGLYYSSVTLLLITLTYFVTLFTGVLADSNNLKRIEFITAIADASIIIVLSLFKKIIVPKQISVGSSTMWIAAENHWYFNIHLAISYIFSLVVICLFTIKLSLTSRLQRAKYSPIIWGLLTVLIFNAVYLIFSLNYDVSLFGYGILSIIIYFCCFIYVPKNLVNVALTNAISDMKGIIVCFDMDDNCVYYNEVAKNYLTKMHDIHTDYKQFCKNYYDHWVQEHPAFFSTENEVIERTINISINGDDRKFDVKAKRNFDEKGLYLGCYFNIIDKTEEFRAQLERELSKRTDPLSGFLNREYFFDQVKDIILKNPDTEYYLTCSNIIDFKVFNSIYGEEQGNQLLVKCAKAIENAGTKMTLYGRISGDIFGFLLEKDRFNERQFHDFVSNLQDDFSNTFYKLRIQYGLYLITNRNEPVSSMCEKVTLSMKNHKNEHDKIIYYYNEDDLGVTLQEKNLLGRFDHALANDEITLFLQPLVDHEGTLIGAEALVRWIESDGTIISPDSFVPLLERNGLISKVDLAVWNLAAQLLSRWAFMGREDLSVSINISMKDFYYLDLYQELTSLVDTYQISPSNLRIEITETTIIYDPVHINEVLQRLREFGFPVEIDDFGSGYSSLGMLKDIAVDVIKLDMGFLKALDNLTDPSHEERIWIVIEEIIRLANRLSMKTIVEGIERKEQVERLYALGCNLFQGYYYAQPEPVELFERRLQD